MRRSVTTAIMLLATSSALATGAAAQTASTAMKNDEKQAGGTANLAIKDIVVTARKLGERLLDTPASVTVLDQSQIQRANITNLNQLGGVVPGLITMQGVAGASATFRGLGSTSADPSAESSVVTFLDGLYLGHSRDYIAPIYDVAQVELIKGTQATLLGKNTSLGAISITSRRPGRDFGYDLAASYGTGIGAARAQGGVDIPLGGTFALRAAGLGNKERGYVRNPYRNDRERKVRELSGRLTLTGDAGPVNLTAIYQHDDRRTDGHTLELLTDPAGVVAARAAALGQTIFDTIPNDRTYTGSDAVGPGAVAGRPQFDDQWGNRAILIASVPLGEHTLTSQTSYIKWRSNRVTDLDQTRARLLELSDSERNRVWSQEIRLSSPKGENLTWLLGGFYYSNNYGLLRGLTGQSGGGIFPLVGNYRNDLDLDTKAWSGFGSADYRFSDRFSISAGLRYTIETKTVTYDRTSIGSFAAPNSSPPIPRITLDPATTRNLDGDIGMKFYATPRTMLYASYSRGSKSGGFQNNPASLAVAPYVGEVAYTAEAGVKYDMLGAGYITAAIFDTRVKNFQVSRSQVVNGLSQTVVANADVGTRGFEGSAVLQIAPGFTLNGSLVYSPAKFLKAFPVGAPVLIAYKGMPLPRAPRWSGQIGARYVTSVSDNLELRVQGSVDYADDAYLQFRTTDPFAPIAKRHALVDAQVALRDEAGGWEIAVIGSNLANRRFILFDTVLSASGGAYYGNQNRPRIVAFQLSLFR